MDTVARFTPSKAPGLVMHIASNEGMVVNPFYHFQIGAMYVDSIIHHAFVQTVAGNYFSFTAGEVRSISLSGEITRVILPFKQTQKA